jgi:hypothetical protein
MPNDGFADEHVDCQCAETHANALACTRATAAFSLGPVGAMCMAWSPVVLFGLAVGFGMSMVMARGVEGPVPGGLSQGDPDGGMVRSFAFTVDTDESRPSWLAAPMSKEEEPPHAAAPEPEEPAVETTDVPLPFEETPVPETPAVRADNKVGVYLTANSVGREKFFKETVDEIIASGGSAIIFDVKGSRVYFHSAAPAANEIGLVAPAYELPSVIQYAREKGLYVMGRLVAIKDDGITGKRPETRVRDPKGTRVLSQTWVDPSNELAVRYNTEVVCELAAAGIDEINLDYIRFSTADFGALSVYSGSEKADKVEVFIKAVREAIDRCGPDTKLGLSTYAILGWNYPVNLETLGQDFVRFAPHVDIISPMAYPATFTSAGYYVPGKHPRSRMYWLVYRTLTGYQELLGPEHAHKIRPWIQGYGVTKKDMREQIDAVYAAGACGYQVWNAGNNYAPTYAAMKEESTRPERCGDGLHSAAPAGPAEIPAMDW